MRLSRVTVALSVLAASAALWAAGPRMDGKWEVKMTMDMPGMPMNMPPMTSTQCVTKEQAADPQRALPQANAGRGGNPNDCKISDYKVDGNKVSWSMACTGREPMSGTGEMVYGDDTYTGTIKVNVQGRGMAIKYEGKRLGDCTP